MSGWQSGALIVFMVATTVAAQRRDRQVAHLAARVAHLENQLTGQCLALSPGDLGFGRRGACSLRSGHRGAHGDGDMHWAGS